MSHECGVATFKVERDSGVYRILSLWWKTTATGTHVLVNSLSTIIPPTFCSWPCFPTSLHSQEFLWPSGWLISCWAAGLKALQSKKEPRDNDSDSNSLLEGGSYMSEAKTIVISPLWALATGRWWQQFLLFRARMRLWFIGVWCQVGSSATRD